MPAVPNPQPPDSPEVRRYNRIKRWLGMTDAVIGFLLLVVLLVTGWTGELRDWSYRLGGQHYFLAVFLYVLMFSLIMKVLSTPLDYFGFRLEHRYNLSNQKMGAWLWDELKGWLLGLVLSAIFVEVIYAIIRIAPQRWWIIAWAVFVGLFLLLAQLAPVVLLPLFYKFEPLNNDGLRERLTRLGERAGTRVRGVYEWKLSEKSKKANAALTGLGGTRRIILADTLLQNYSDDEIEAVLAHELGHHVRRHILKGIFMQVAITFFGFWLTNLVLRFALARDWFPTLDPRLYDFANLPLIILVATLLGFLLMPAMNALSRKHEREADLYAWENIPAIGPFVTAMQKLADQNLSERTPSRFVEWFFESHPAIGKRVAAAEAWARSR
jgi:STE24 endopeptidase